MKKFVVYYFDQDGIYSTIRRIEKDSQAVCNEFVKEYPNHYFKTFGEAKKRLVEESKFEYESWKAAFQDAKSLTKKEVDEASN